MTRSFLQLSLGALALSLLSCICRAQERLPGFTTSGSATERSLEARFDGTIRREDLKEWMQILSAHPHHVGAPYDRKNAEFIAGLFRSWGYQTEIESFDVLFPTPIYRRLEMTAPGHFRARLDEPAIAADRTSSDRRDMLPSYNAYSADGDVRGPLVYVNYGIPADYKVLEARGIDVKGKIVIARYGGSWRGIKPKVAAEHGAIGCLIYSDPRDDGYFQGETYPDGPFRNRNGAQRGSVADIPVFSGDPLTPGVGATKDAHRLDRRSAPTLMKIPVLPISWSDAEPLLRALGGPTAPEAWRGALPITYRLGPGPAAVHLKVAFSWKLTPIYDVIARQQGSRYPDSWILRGNHFDAWVFGAEDPLSGTVALMEEARSIGELARSGDRPARTVIYTVWDGEEPGLLGSTEWVETHAEELDKKAVLYVNSDSNGRGFLSAGGSHTLQRLLDGAARSVIDPETGVTVAERARANRLINGSPEVKKETKASGETPLSPLGSGSDYTPFLQHLGVASLNLGYGGESPGGSYHSVYDSFDWYTRFGDPEFRYGVALAQVAGCVVLRAANAEALSWRFTALAEALSKYRTEIAKLVDTERDETADTNRYLSEKLYALTFDPKEVHAPPPADAPVPSLEFGPLQTAIERIRKNARTADVALDHLDEHGQPVQAELLHTLNDLLVRTERLMLRTEGLPGRPWYRHQIYAPGLYTGYGVKTLPGVREAVEERQWDLAKAQILKLTETLDAIATELERIEQAARSAAL